MEIPKYVKCIRAESSGYTLNRIYLVNDRKYVVSNKGEQSLTNLRDTDTFTLDGRTYSGNSDFKSSTEEEYNIQEGILRQVVNSYEIY